MPAGTPRARSRSPPDRSARSSRGLIVSESAPDTPGSAAGHSSNCAGSVVTGAGRGPAREPAALSRLALRLRALDSVTSDRHATNRIGAPPRESPRSSGQPALGVLDKDRVERGVVEGI